METSPTHSTAPKGLDRLRRFAAERLHWPFLYDVEQDHPERASARTNFRTDLSGWVHVPEQVRAFSQMVERVLAPGEPILGITELSYRAPLSTQAHLYAERKRLRERYIPSEAVSVAEFDLGREEFASVVAIADPKCPLPAQFTTSGSFLAAPSVRDFTWGSEMLRVVPMPASLRAFLESQVDEIDLAHVLLTNAARRAAFDRSPALLFVTSVRNFELPSRDVLIQGGTLHSTFDPTRCKRTKKGFVTCSVHTHLLDTQGHLDGQADFQFAVTEDLALALQYAVPLPR